MENNPAAPPPLLSQPGLVAALTSRTLGAFSSQVQAVAVGWQIYALTHSAAALGFVGLAQFLPMVAFIFPAGHAADQHDRRRIVITCQAIEALAAAFMALASFAHFLAPGMIYGLVALFGVCRAFEMPAQQTFLPSLVPTSVFPRAAALSSSLFQVASIAGPSLGGLLYGLGAGVCYALCAAGFAIAALATTSMTLRFPARPRQPATLAAVFGGISFLRRKPAMLGALSLDLFAVLLGGATAMLPLFATDILHAGPWGLGLLRAAPAIGALLVATVLARYPLGRHAGRWMFVSVMIFGVATIIFGLSRSIPVSILALAVLGGADVISVMVRSALVQLGTPDEMRGRVSAVNMLFIGSSNQLGEFESGMLASAIGAVPAVVVGGIGTLVITAVWMALFPGLRELDRLDDITPDEKPL
ncbi:MFS transporter [Acetobacter persici]|uniref:MFS transporter n=2 Tax=Acetobacter persici TaxID=1076596 RepID=A0A1U9LEV9_9PROT|nr:MFS transporter [Acetobacter persici]AQT04917.1 MFS transporter [Acetobacter persici]MBS0962900.1 MFS transporter [Acetobacter persici]MBS0999759.1 MFS transporter [Acetobacter persici]MBS1016456.1 MFS transporter [Acetobacter persici]MCG0999444.1 MFS transporter [Acetobacter persici]